MPVGRYNVHQGPSPRVRGKPPSSGGCRAAFRSIPACAGETACLSTPALSRPVHPRVCGGNPVDARPREPVGGPSPRVRGKHAESFCRRTDRRSIPACAGETPVRSPSGHHRRVHPRVCGGNTTMRAGQHRIKGPSPRVRGKPPQSRQESLTTGSIPACAGETPHRRQRQRPTRVHPRVCGGNNREAILSLLVDGPSPRVRGKRLHPRARSGRRGSIPACAGETRMDMSIYARYAVHPRVCGGNVIAAVAAAIGPGPSPRVRGKLDQNVL